MAAVRRGDEPRSAGSVLSAREESLSGRSDGLSFFDAGHGPPAARLTREVARSGDIATMFGAGLSTPPTPFRGPGPTAGHRPKNRVWRPLSLAESDPEALPHTLGIRIVGSFSRWPAPRPEMASGGGQYATLCYIFRIP